MPRRESAPSSPPVVCCVGLPAIGALIGGVSVGAVLGVGAAVLVFAAVVSLGALAVGRRLRRRLGCGRRTEGS